MKYCIKLKIIISPLLATICFLSKLMILIKHTVYKEFKMLQLIKNEINLGINFTTFT